MWARRVEKAAPDPSIVPVATQRKLSRSRQSCLSWDWVIPVDGVSINSAILPMAISLSPNGEGAMVTGSVPVLTAWIVREGGPRQ